jgi:hypothetical protein
MKYYAHALWKILASWYVYVALFLDLIGILLTYSSGVKVPSVVYVSILGVGFLLSCTTTVAEQLRALDNSCPQVISNDNLSLGGPNLSIDSISLRNIGGGIAKVTNISSDAQGKIRIIDAHYMESFIMDPGYATPHNIMINEAKIIDGLGNIIARPSSIVQDWREPFYIYVWYESLSDKKKFCTRIKFQSGEKFIRNLGWAPFNIK